MFMISYNASSHAVLPNLVNAALSDTLMNEWLDEYDCLDPH